MENNEKLKYAIRRIVAAGGIKDFRVFTGFVTHVYPEGDPNYGKVDFNNPDQSIFIPEVLLSSIDGNVRGNIKLPAEDSEITVLLIDDKEAHVIDYTHIDTEIIDVDTSFKIGATGVEDMDDIKDYNEVNETGLKTVTEHTPDKIDSKVIDQSGSNNKLNQINRTAGLSESLVNDISGSNSTKISQTPTDAKIEAGAAFINVKDSETEIKSSKITLGNGGSTEKAVLGDTLKSVLDAFIDQVAAIMTTTQLGPMPILNKVQVTALKVQVNTILSNVNLLE